MSGGRLGQHRGQTLHSHISANFPKLCLNFYNHREVILLVLLKVHTSTFTFKNLFYRPFVSSSHCGGRCQIISVSSVIGGNVLFTQSQLSAIRVNKGGQGNKAEQKCETITKSRDNVSRVAEHSHWRICFNGFNENPDITKVSEFPDTKLSTISVFGEKLT